MDPTASQTPEVYKSLPWQEQNQSGTFSIPIPYTRYSIGVELINASSGMHYYFNLPLEGKTLDNSTSGLYEYATKTQKLKLEVPQDITEYVVMKSRLSKLFSIIEEYPDEIDDATTPTSYAQSKAEELIYKTFKLMGNEFYRGSITTSFEGGIRVDWMRARASVRLVIPASENGPEYIFFEDNDHYDTERVTAENLSNRLKLLKRAMANE